MFIQKDDDKYIAGFNGVHEDATSGKIVENNEVSKTLVELADYDLENLRRTFKDVLYSKTVHTTCIWDSIIVQVGNYKRDYLWFAFTGLFGKKETLVCMTHQEAREFNDKVYDLVVSTKITESNDFGRPWWYQTSRSDLN